MTDTLNRWAAVVPVFVEAGCEGPKNGIGFVCLPDGRWTTVLQTSASFDGRESLIIAANEQWFSQTVVPWAEDHMKHFVHLPKSTDGLWKWAAYTEGDVWAHTGQDPSPTESFIQCAEALAGVIGGKQ